MTRDEGALPSFEQSTYRAGRGPRYTAMAVYRLVLLGLLAVSVVAGAVLLVTGFGPAHPAMIAGYVVAGLAVCLFAGSFLDSRGSHVTPDATQGTDYAVTLD